jgi:hypothetical protein
MEEKGTGEERKEDPARLTVPFSRSVHYLAGSSDESVAARG